MSRYDFFKYAGVAGEFRYGRLTAIFATNSIKLYRRSTNNRRAQYMWIDPSWELWRGQSAIIFSGSYPNPSKPGGQWAERVWLKEAGALGTRRFLGVSLTFDGYADFRFSDFWTIRAAGLSRAREDEQWYDDWYAKGREQLPS